MRYGTHARLELDIFAPAGEGGKKWSEGDPLRPTVLFFYGGSWKKGNRGLYRPLGSALSTERFAVAIADYRLFPEVTFPGFMEDAAGALSWVKEFAPTFGGNPDDITVMGHSAGAHMGALLCLDPHYLESENLNPSIISRFVGLAGPYSANLVRAGSVAPIFSEFEDNDRTRPIKLVAEGPTMPRSLLLHGLGDKTVGSHNTENFAAAITDSGANVITHYYKDIGHIGLLLSLAPPLRWRAPSWRDTLEFLKNS